MEQSADATEENAESVEKFGKEADESGKKALSLGDVIKANLISDAIKSGLSALASGISAVGSAMSESLTAGAEYADNILTLSTQTGVSTDNLQKFNAVAELVDVSTETMTKSMAKNIKSMTSAQEGTGAMAEAYSKLGVSVTNADGSLRDGETVYWETIDALKNVTDETERDALAMEILGKSAQELNPLIAQGSEGIKAMGDEAVKMGAVLSEDALNSLGAVDDEMQRFSSISGSTSNLLASAFAPAVSSLMGGVNDLGGSFNYLLSSIIGGDEGGIAEASTMITEGVTAMVETISTQAPAIMDIVVSLLETIVNVIAENLPILIENGVSMLTSILSGIGDNLANVIPVIMSVISTLITTVLENLPMILAMGIQMLTSLVKGIADSLPEIIPVMINSVVLMVETLLDNIDLIIDTGIDLIFALAEGLIVAIPDLLDAIPVIIDKLIQALTNNIPLLIEMGITLVVQLGVGLIKAIPNLVKAVPQIISSVVSGFANYYSKLGEVGRNLVKGLWNGIRDATGWILDKIRGFGSTILNGIKSIFGIHSPSTLFRDEVGKNLALGVGEGFADTMADVSADMQGAIPTEFDTNVHTTGAVSPASNYDVMLMALKQALTEVKVVMNNREMGAFVTDTMERVVYA
jgi:phage-related protein